MFHIRILLYLILEIIFKSTHAWDLAVSSEGRILLFSTKSNVIERSVSTHVLDDGARGLALDAAQDLLYFTAKHDGSSVRSLVLGADETNSSTVVAANLEGDELIQSLVFNPDDGFLYWSDSDAQAIFKVETRGSSVTQIVHQFKNNEVPLSLAIDTCRGFLYWTNMNYMDPSIERSLLNGKDRQVLVSDNLFKTLGLTLDTSGRGKMYWGNDLEGIHFSIERSDLDGSHREELLRGHHHMPFSLALVGKSLYWSDWTHNAVWTIDLNTPRKHRTESKVLQFQSHVSFSILVNSNDSSCSNVNDNLTEESSTMEPTTTTITTRLTTEEATTTTTKAPPAIVVPQWQCYSENKNDYCLAGGRMIAPNFCECPVGFAGSRCEQYLCQNYCLNNGKCVSGVAPTCICPSGFTGLRCELRVCDNYCLNGGSCQVSDSGTAHCHCDARFSGPRCEVRRDLCGDNCDCSSGGAFPCVCDHLIHSNITNINETSASCLMSAQASGMTSTYIIISLTALCIGLLLVIGALSWKVAKLCRRPRLKRRVVVSRREVSVPPGFGGSTTNENGHNANGDTCEITIENCCNMNICETPCFDPPVRSPGKKNNKRDEKKTLLSDMEDQN